MIAAASQPLKPTTQTVPSWGGRDSAGNKTYKLHKGQSDVMRAHARFKGAIAGTGGGKTALGPVWILERIQQHIKSGSTEPVLGLVVAPTYQIMARATAPTLVSTLMDTDLEGTYVESKNRYYLPRGLGVIWLLSADSPGSLEGGQFDWAWLDEGGQLKYDSWVAIQGRVGQKQSPVLVTTTPYGLNWLYKEFYKRWAAGDKDYYVRQWPSNSNPAYPTAEYERAKRTMSPQRAAMRYDGQFVKMAGLVYPTLEDCRVDHFDPPPGRLVGGIDWGWNNPFAAVGAALYVNEYGDDVLYVHYERYKRFTTLAEHARAIPRGHYWYADPAEPDSIASLRVAGHACRAADNSIITGIDAVSNRLYTRRLLISDRCKALFGESQLYSYPTKDDEPYGDRPIDDNNHALGALRYMVMGVDRRQIARSRGTAGRHQEQEQSDVRATATA